MASDEDRVPKFVHIDEQYGNKGNDPILFGFEQELKSVTVRYGDSARFEAKIRLTSTSSNIQIDRSLLNIEWRLNDIRITSDNDSRYRFDSIQEENLYWMDIRQCEQQDEGVYTIYISYDHDKYHDESSAYLFVDSFITEKEEQPDQISQRGLTAGDSWSSATSLDRFIPPTITQPLLSTYRYRSGDRVQLQVEYFSPSVQCHCTWQVQHIGDAAPQLIQDGSIVNTNYSSTLTIDSITPELQGVYLFQVENVYGQAMTQTYISVDQEDIDDEQQEYQEAFEEPPIKKKHLEDESHLQLMGPFHKRISMMHHMPLDESLRDEALKVHLPGEITEEIIIHTEFIPPTPRLSLIEEQSTDLPIKQNLLSEQIQTGDTYKIEDVDIKITMDQQQLQPEKKSADQIQFDLLLPSLLSDTVLKSIREDIPQTSALRIQQQQQQLTRPTDDNLTVIEKSQTITSVPIALDTALSSVEQWSDVISDHDTFVLPSFRQASRISHLSTSANEYEDEQHIAHPLRQRLSIGSIRTSDKVDTIQQPEVGPYVPLLDESSIALNQFRLPEIPQSYEYKAPIDIKQEPIALLRTSALAMSSDDMEIHETPINISHIRHQESGGTKQRATSISQPSVTIDFSILDESPLHLDQLQRPELSQSIEYKLPADIQLSTSSILTTTSALSQEEPAEETAINITQFIQSTAQDLPVSETKKTTTVVRLDQVHRPDAPQSIQYKAPPDIQPSVGTILTTASGLISEELAHDTPVNISQLRQPIAKDVSVHDTIQQQASSVMQLSAATDLSIFDETSIHVDQIHRPDAPQSIQYKAPADIEPSIGSIRTHTSTLSIEEPAQEVPINVSQVHQATAQELSDEIKQRALDISQRSKDIDLSSLDETAINIEQFPQAEESQSVEYKLPTNLKQVSATLLSTPSVLASETEHDETILTSVEGYQQQQGHKTYRPAVISDLSLAPAEDEFAELPYEIQLQQQRLLKMPPKLHEQPILIQSRTSIIEGNDETQSTMIGQRRQMIPSVQKEEEEEEEEEEKSISRESSMNVDEVIETIYLEDELLEPKKSIVSDIPVSTDEDISSLVPTVGEVVPSIEEVPQTTDKEISMQINQLETVRSDQSINEELQSSLNRLDQVSLTQPTSLHLQTTEEILSSATIEKAPETLVPEKIEEPLEIVSKKIVDYIEIPHSTTDLDKNKPEAIIVIDEMTPSEGISRVADATSHIAPSESLPTVDFTTETIQQIQGDVTSEQFSLSALSDKGEKSLKESVESLSVPAQPNLLPLATMPDETTEGDKLRTPDKIVQDVLVAALEPTSVSQVEHTAQTIPTSSLTQLQTASTFQTVSFDQDVSKDTTKVQSVKTASPVPVSMEPDQFFDAESESTGEIAKTEIKKLTSFHEQPITLAAVEKLQHDVAVEQQMDEFHEPELPVTSIEAPLTGEPQPLETSLEQTTSATKEIPSKTQVQEQIKPVESTGLLQQESALPTQEQEVAHAAQLLMKIIDEQKQTRIELPETTLPDEEKVPQREKPQPQPVEVQKDEAVEKIQLLPTPTSQPGETQTIETVEQIKQQPSPTLPPTEVQIVETVEQIQPQPTSESKPVEQLQQPTPTPQPVKVQTIETVEQIQLQPTSELKPVEQIQQQPTPTPQPVKVQTIETVEQIQLQPTPELKPVEQMQQQPTPTLQPDKVQTVETVQQIQLQPTPTRPPAEVPKPEAVEQMQLQQVPESKPVEQIQQQSLPTAQPAEVQKAEAVEQTQLQPAPELSAAVDKKAEPSEGIQLKHAPEVKPEPLIEKKPEEAEQPRPKPALEETTKLVEEQRAKEPKETQPELGLERKSVLLEEQKPQTVQQPQLKLASEEKPKPPEQEKVEQPEQLQSKKTPEEKPKPLEEKKDKKVEQPQQKPVPEEQPKLVEEEKVKQPEQLLVKPVPEEKPKPVEEQKGKTPEQPQVKPVPEEKPKPVEEQKATKPEEVQPKPAPEETPKPVEEKKVEQPQPKSVPEAQPKLVEEKKVKQPEQPLVKPALEEKLKLDEEQKGKAPEQPEVKPVPEEKPKPIEEQKAKKPEEPQPKPAPEEKPKPVEEKKDKKVEQPQPKPVPEGQPTLVEEEKVKQPEQPLAKPLPEEKPKPVEEQKRKKPEQLEVKAVPEEKPKPIEEQKAKKPEEPQPKPAPEEKPKPVEETKDKKVEQPQPKPVPEEQPKLVEEEKVKQPEQPLAKPLPEEKPKPVEEQKGKKPEQPEVKAVPEEKPKPIEEQKATKPEETQPKPTPEEKPKAVEKKKVEQPQPKSVPEEQPKLIEKEKVEQPLAKPAPEEKPKP
ncbi:unnamed protein product, partial [Rotaria sordida]